MHYKYEQVYFHENICIKDCLTSERLYLAVKRHQRSAMKIFINWKNKVEKSKTGPVGYLLTESYPEIFLNLTRMLFLTTVNFNSFGQCRLPNFSFSFSTCHWIWVFFNFIWNLTFLYSNFLYSPHTFTIHWFQSKMWWPKWQLNRGSGYKGIPE